MIADNRSAELVGWDKAILAIELQVTITGFDIAEIDLIIEGAKGVPDKDDAIELGPNLPAVTRLGDVWRLGRHTIACADALVHGSYDAVLRGSAAHAIFTDPPYNLTIRARRRRNTHDVFGPQANDADLN